MQTNNVITTQKALEMFKNDKELVFVSGCFDVLHFGHIYFLRQAKMLGKKLLVVIHDDESIRKKKGENRPINPVGYRLEMLKELKSVDFITVWNGWETIADFFKELKPGTIAVTRGTYEKKTIKQIADEIGVNLVPIDFKQGISTTNILEKLEL